MKYNPTTRIRLISLSIILISTLLSVRLFFLQIIKGDDYYFAADRQYLNSVATLFNRGVIYFTDKDGNLVPAATLKQDFSISANPQLVPDATAVYDKLAAIIPSFPDQKTFTQQLNVKESVYLPLAKGLSLAQAEAVKKENLKGIFIHREKKRHYPAGETAAHVLGFMAYQGHDYAGRYGLEKEFDQLLSRDKTGSFASFIAELFLGFGKTLAGESGQAANLILTIEPVVQTKLESELAKLAKIWAVEQAGGIIMNPQTGEILAMAAWPAFDPGGKVAKIEILTNPLIERVYEMGSVVKAITMAIGLDTGAITPATTYYDAGFLVLNNRTITNYDGKSRGTVNMQEVLNQSLNTGAAFVVDQVGHRRFGDYLLNFGLGEPTGIDLPDEVSGLVGNLRSKREVEYATASFGQGIAVTPLAMTRAFAVLANGGKLIKPHVVKKIDYEDGMDKKNEPIITRQVITEETARTVTDMLVKTVDTALVGGKYSLPHYRVAAKTGTAQIANQESGGYYDDRFLHSFFGYFPATRPQFVGFIYLINPRGARFASETLSESFMDLVQFLLNYYEVPPDR